jgi:WD40 repeat protein
VGKDAAMRKWILFFSGIMSSALAAQAAPICRSALLSPPTQEQVETTLDGLARMTLTVDLLKSSGHSHESARTMFVQKYQEKLVEVQQSLNLDLPTLRKFVSERIARMQQQEKTESENRTMVERNIRNELKIVRPEYVLKKTYTDLKLLPFPLVYFPETKSILTLNKDRTLLLLNLESRKSKVLVKNVRGMAFSPDKKYTYLISSDGNLSTYLTGTKDLVSSVKLGLSANAIIRSLDVSDNASKVAVSITSETRVFDLNTGEKIYSSNLTKRSTALFTKFRGEDELFIASNAGEILRYDFKTQKTLSRTVTDSIPIGLLTSPSSQNIIVTGVEGRVYFYNANTLEPTQLKPSYYNARGLNEVSRMHGLFSMINISYKIGRNENGGIYHYSDLSAPIFDFNNEYADYVNKKVDAMAISPDAKSVVIFYETETPNNYIYSIDLWELK